MINKVINNYYDIQWLLRYYSDNHTNIEESSCNLQAHLKRRTSLIGGKSFLCNACKAMTYYAPSDWENDVPFTMNDDEWTLSIHSIQDHDILKESSKNKLIPKHSISYVCGDKYVVLKKYGTVTNNLQHNEKVVNDVIRFILKNSQINLWCNYDIHNFIYVNKQLYLKSVDDIIFMKSDGMVVRNRTKDIEKDDNKIIISNNDYGHIMIPELQEYVITSMYKFHENIRLGKFDQLGINNPNILAAINFYRFMTSILVTSELQTNEYVSKIFNLMFRKSELKTVRKTGSLEGITIYVNIFEILKHHKLL